MTIEAQSPAIVPDTDILERMETYFDRLWPICRSIAGEGYRQSLDILSEIVPFDRHRFPTGSRVLDWIVPKEWVARDAYLIDPNGRKRASFKENNLHLINYSVPFQGKLSLSELKPHLRSIPDKPDAIPYVISYYEEVWGFCMTHRELVSLPDGLYTVVVDTDMVDGHVEVGEAVLPGSGEGEVLFSTNLCHPSLANNELSGPLVTAFLYEKVAAMRDRRHTYRFVVAPETIGAVCYLSLKGSDLKKRLKAGYQITCVGSPGPFTYKLSRQETSLSDRAARVVLRDLGPHEILPFDPFLGSDDRQYGSPGFNLPVGSLMRSRYMHYPEYHTSLDNKSFIRFESLKESVDAYAELVLAIEKNKFWRNTVLYGEPQLGRRGLYFTDGTPQSKTDRYRAMFWLLNQADGTRDLLSIAEKSGQPLRLIVSVAEDLERAGLLQAI